MKCSMEEITSNESKFQDERLWAKRSKVRAVLSITHPGAVIIFGISSLILAIIAEQGLPNFKISLLLVIAMVTSQISIGITNEIFDYELDKKTKPWRALPSGDVSVQGAWLLLFGVLLLQFFASILISFESFAFLLFLTVIGVLYSAILKRTAFSWVPYAIAYPSVPIWVWLSLNKLALHLFIIYLITFPYVLAIHMINQLRDYDDDLKMGIKGFIHHLGKSQALTLSFALLLFGPVLFFLGNPSRDPIAFFIVGLASLLHWILILPCIYRYMRNPDPILIREIFKRLRIAGPIILFAWLLSI